MRRPTATDAGASAFQTLDLTVDVDPWWVAYRVLELEPGRGRASRSRAGTRGRSTTCAASSQRGAPESVHRARRTRGRTDRRGRARANPAVDAVVRGEGEATFAELLDAAARAARRRGGSTGVTARDGDEDRLGAGPGADRRPGRDPVAVPHRRARAAATARRTSRPTAAARTAAATASRARATGASAASQPRARGGRDRRGRGRARRARRSRSSTPVFNLTAERLGGSPTLLAPHAARGVRLHTIEVDIERIDDEAAALLRARGRRRAWRPVRRASATTALATCRRGVRPGAVRGRRRGAASARASRSSATSSSACPATTPDDFLAGLRFVHRARSRARSRPRRCTCCREPTSCATPRSSACGSTPSRRTRSSRPRRSASPTCGARGPVARVRRRIGRVCSRRSGSRRRVQSEPRDART